jgi:hypothetical protein
VWVKCTTSAECKTVLTAVLTVKSGLDPHMIIKLKDGNKSWILWVFGLWMSFKVKWVGINLYLVTRCCKLKLDQLIKC